MKSTQMKDKLKNLAVRLLDDEDGITDEAYAALLDVLPEQVKATEGRFYLPENHGLDWKI